MTGNPRMPATVVCAAALLFGCAHTQEEHDAMLAEIEQLKAANVELQEESQERIAQLMAQLEELQEELEEYKSLAQKRAEVMKQLMEDLAGLIEAGKLEVKMVDGKMMLELPGNVLFPSNSTTLGTDGQSVLGDVADALGRIEDIDFQVEGHTDSDPIKGGPFQDNWELSCQRALVVVRYLEEQGVEPVHLSAAGYSKYQPVAPNETEADKAKNRRIEITIIPDLSELPDPEKIAETL